MPDQNASPYPLSVLDEIEGAHLDEIARESTEVIILMGERALLRRRIAGNLALLQQVESAIQRHLDRHPESGQ